MALERFVWTNSLSRGALCSLGTIQRCRRSWQWFRLSTHISAGLGSRCEVTAPDLCLLTHPFIRLLHLSGVSSTAVTYSISGASVHYVMIQNPALGLMKERERCADAVFPSLFSLFQSWIAGLQQPLLNPLSDTETGPWTGRQTWKSVIDFAVQREEQHWFLVEKLIK